MHAQTNHAEETLEFTGLGALAERVTAALITCGYPCCPGNMMLSNRLWCQPLAAFKQTLRGWLFDGEPDGAMDLAIFLDAAAVASDTALLQQARHFVDEFLVDNDAFFARFASAADQFAEPAGWWARSCRACVRWPCSTMWPNWAPPRGCRCWPNAATCQRPWRAS